MYTNYKSVELWVEGTMRLLRIWFGKYHVDHQSMWSSLDQWFCIGLGSFLAVHTWTDTALNWSWIDLYRYVWRVVKFTWHFESIPIWKPAQNEQKLSFYFSWWSLSGCLHEIGSDSTDILRQLQNVSKVNLTYQVYISCKLVFGDNSKSFLTKGKNRPG